MNATALLIKSLVRDHAETYPAGQDKGPRCRELYDALLTEFGHDRLGQFSLDEIQTRGRPEASGRQGKSFGSAGGRGRLYPGRGGIAKGRRAHHAGSRAALEPRRAARA